MHTVEGNLQPVQTVNPLPMTGGALTMSLREIAKPLVKAALAFLDQEAMA